MSGNTTTTTSTTLQRFLSHEKVQWISKNTNFDPNNCEKRSPSLQEVLQQYWNQCILIDDDDQTKTKQHQQHQEWFPNRIDAPHNEMGKRFYHTSLHLKEMLDYLQALILLSSTEESPLLLQSTNKSITALRLATFFHDLVYNPQSATNEKDSEALFQEYARAVELPRDVRNLVSTMILATEKHQVIVVDNPPIENVNNQKGNLDLMDNHLSIDMDDPIKLQKLFLDLDMAVLGKQKDAYMAYAALIRKEYEFVDHQVYCQKRAVILSGFLKDRPTIYMTQLFHQALEARARSNLQAEIELLQQGRVPGDDETKQQQEELSSP